MDGKMEENKFTAFRCIDPTIQRTNDTWFSYADSCPCNLKYNDISGRGLVNCPYGVQEPLPYDNAPKPLMTINNSGSVEYLKKLPSGTLFAGKQYIPPQEDPRSLKRIGLFWRS